MSISTSIKRILDPTRIPKPILFSTAASSPPSDPQTPDPIISDAVSILIHHRSKSRWSNLRSLTTSFTPKQFSQIALHLRNNPHLALRFFLFTTRYRLCHHDHLSFSTLIHILTRHRLRGHALEITRIALRLVPQGNDRNTSDNAVSCGNEFEGLFRTLVRTYNECGSSPFVFDVLIRSCLESKRIDGCLMVVRKLRSYGISPRISTCNAVVSEVCRRRGATVGYKVYQEVFGFDCGEGDVKWVSKVRPNAQTFNGLMVAFYREGEMEKVEEIWGEMEGVGCVPNTYSYCVLMAVYCDRGLMGETEKVWEEMTVRGLEHDVFAYNTIIGGLCKNGEILRAEEFLQEMVLKGIESTCATYEHLLNGYCKVGDVDSALLAYKDMRRKEFRPEGLTMEVLIKGICDRSRVFEALEVMKAAIRDFGFCANGKSYELLIKGLCEEGKMDEALKLQAEMVGRGFEPNLVVYTVFIDGYTKVGNEEMAASLRKEMVEYLKRQGEEEEEEEEGEMLNL